MDHLPSSLAATALLSLSVALAWATVAFLTSRALHAGRHLAMPSLARRKVRQLRHQGFALVALAIVMAIAAVLVEFIY